MHGTGLPTPHTRGRRFTPDATPAGSFPGTQHAGPAYVPGRPPAASRAADASILDVLQGVGLPLRAFDAGTISHSERVATYATEIAAALGLSRGEINKVRLGAFLHDVGKLKVSPGILRKAGRLTDPELAIMKMHPIWGLEVLEGVHLPFDVRPTIRWHHEKCDGTGYPDGLAGERIPLHASIVAVADVYDALTSSRSYRPPMSSSGALALMRVRQGWWRPEVYEAFGRAAASTTRGAAILVAAVAATRRRQAAIGSAVA